MIDENNDSGVQAPVRRQRLERIATAERDRRAGRVEVARAAIGEPKEWPARVVLALAQLDDGEAYAARRQLEEGLDRWADEAGLGPLELLDVTDTADETDALDVEADDLEVEAEDLDVEAEDLDVEAEDLEIEADARDEEDALLADFSLPAEAPLERPLDSLELDRAFAEAEAQTDEMHDVNRVAERVLLDEPVGLSEISDEASSFVPPLAGLEEGVAGLSVDAAFVDEAPMIGSERGGAALVEAPGLDSEQQVLATLERWLQNLERRRAGRA